MTLILLLSSILTQTQIDPSQVNWNMVDESFYKQCIPDQHVTVHIINPNHLPGTSIQVSQIKNYGVSVENSNTLVIRTWTYTQRFIFKPTATGSIQLKFIMLTPNIKLIGIDFNEIEVSSGGWGMTKGESLSSNEMLTAHILQGNITIEPRRYVFKDACGWQ